MSSNIGPKQRAKKVQIAAISPRRSVPQHEKRSLVDTQQKALYVAWWR